MTVSPAEPLRYELRLSDLRFDQPPQTFISSFTSWETRKEVVRLCVVKEEMQVILVFTCPRW